jgi:ATP-dependent Clp protease ATP-binding subunit ClpC
MNEPAGALNLSSLRAKQARLSRHIGKYGEFGLWLLCVSMLTLSLYVFFLAEAGRFGYLSLAAASACAVVALWYKYAIKTLPIRTPAQSLDDVIPANILARLKAPLTPQSLWNVLATEPTAQFMTNHLLLHPPSVAGQISSEEQAMSGVWQQAAALASAANEQELHGGILATAIILQTPGLMATLTASKMGKEDIMEVLAWTQRELALSRRPKPYFGGLGRDWATGFTPVLEQFSQNISHGIETAGGLIPHRAHADLLDGISHNLSQGSAVALVGYDGTGKTALVDGLAQHLLEGNVPNLRYYQVVSLNASMILSHQGAQLEQLILRLFGEAVSAGNIILFLDDAHLFFGSGVGAFDMSQVLQPVLKNHNLKLIAAFTPGDWQDLRNLHGSLAESFTPITVNEPSGELVMEVVEDIAVGLEHQQRLLISYEAVREAYRLSGQYMQEQSYPGKAIQLLEQAFPYASHQVVTAASVQQAVEKTRGVRVSAAAAPEVDMLLHLEDRIHERMINQTRAVGVVASALRRGRAGVSNPKRPVGSFLFLGPTGVGKTELARSLAAVYFGDENQMIRLDMSEYQQASDVTRLLATGGSQEQSLIASIRQQPFTVVLFDEIEKAHPNILNLFLQMLDEGQLTDEQGRPASFKSSIIIATSNAGAVDITQQVKTTGNLEAFERPLVDKLIREGQFKPELVNRFDEVVLFRPLTEEELAQVANVMLREVNRTLATQHITVQLTDAALKQIVHAGYDPEFGARPMRRIIQKTVENAVAVKILQGQAQPGSTITLDVPDLAPTE